MGPKTEPTTGPCRLRRCELGDFLSPGDGSLSRGTVIIDGISDSGVDGREDCAVAERVRSTSVGILDECLVGEM